MMRVSKEDVLLFGCYGMRGSGKSYIEKLKEKDKEIERLKEEIKGYEQERERVLNIIEERNHKAIEYIEENKTTHECNELSFDNMLEDIIPLLDILKGDDKE